MTNTKDTAIYQVSWVDEGAKGLVDGQDVELSKG